MRPVPGLVSVGPRGRRDPRGLRLPARPAPLGHVRRGNAAVPNTRSGGFMKEAEKKPYEAPAFRIVRLEVSASVLSICLASVGVSPNGGTCKTIDSSCF